MEQPIIDSIKQKLWQVKSILNALRVGEHLSSAELERIQFYLNRAEAELSKTLAYETKTEAEALRRRSLDPFLRPQNPKSNKSDPGDRRPKRSA